MDNAFITDLKKWSIEMERVAEGIKVHLCKFLGGESANINFGAKRHTE